ncbi:hypothetical protein, partial [Microcoleus sp. B9-D4]|uniref:hypothetical protein n=1 Tax=Microcoleus sp. B9-D4 TaxID=2818711 RepID=UPI002FD7520D
SRPSFLDGRDAHPTNLWKLFNSHSLAIALSSSFSNKSDRPFGISQKVRSPFTPFSQPKASPFWN